MKTEKKPAGLIIVFAYIDAYYVIDMCVDSAESARSVFSIDLDYRMSERINGLTKLCVNMLY